jgi:CHAT domain-containing protein
MHAEANPEDKARLSALDDKVGQLHEAGKFNEAIPIAEEALKLSEKAFGPDDPQTANHLYLLALVYMSMDYYAKAEPLFQRSLKINEKVLGPEHPSIASDLNNLGDVNRSMDDYAKAEPLYQRALKIRENVLGHDHPGTAVTLTSLAWLYFSIGDYVKAEALGQRALKIRQKVLGLDHPDTVGSLNVLAEIYRSRGEYAKAEPLYERALAIEEKAVGPDHPNTATALSNRALLYESMGDYAKAKTLYERSLKIQEKTPGPDHPNTAATLNNLAGVYRALGDNAKADPLYQRALEIIRRALGPDHKLTAASLHNLAYLKIDLGEEKNAIALVAQARQAQEKHLSNILSFTSEDQRLQFQKTTNPYTLLATLGHAAEIAQTVLRQKGVVLDSLLEDRLVAEASGDPNQREIIEQLRAAKQRLMQLVLEVPKALSEAAQKKRAAEKEKLAGEVEQLEAGLARQVAGLGKARRALSVTVVQVQVALPKQGALIELLRYSHYLGKGKFEPRYGAVLISASGEPKWIPLGGAEEIEKKIQLYRKSARGETDEATLSTVLKALQEQVWAPIEKVLPAGTTTVIVSPDAELSFVSFATLLTSDDRFVGEKYSIRYVASGRDLLRETKPAAAAKISMRVFADPNFAMGRDADKPSEGKTNERALRSVERRDLQSISLPELPGTARESAKLEERAKKSGWQAQATLGSNATEAELRKINSPRILHLATHGFFLPEIDIGPPPDGLSRTAADIPKGKLVNPMHRSGLAVAGAQTTLHAWAKGEVPPTENDGIVTAEEVSGLKLDGTWLVVLSACDTGSGEAKAGEGVLGLRRGFVQAGGQNLLMTLWPISDETTVQIMLDFYAAAFKTGNAPEALADTQRDWLVKLRKEKGLLPAVRLAGPFIMSSQGK